MKTDDPNDWKRLGTLIRAGPHGAPLNTPHLSPMFRLDFDPRQTDLQQWRPIFAL
jgi:hypothetical protein